ncbi:MAG: amidohydrolase family protein [Chloroflexi bacterium]|nr:amidohydrolase family protein [Chloroflexota bacterium]
MNPDLIIHNAKIYTVDPQLPWAEAVAVHNGRFLSVGANQEILTLAGSETTVIDANGRLLLPGLIDSHVHFLDTAERNQQLSLFRQADFGEALRQVETAVAQKRPVNGCWAGAGMKSNGIPCPPPPTWTPSPHTRPSPWLAWTCTPTG